MRRLGAVDILVILAQHPHILEQRARRQAPPSHARPGSARARGHPASCASPRRRASGTGAARPAAARGRPTHGTAPATGSTGFDAINCHPRVTMACSNSSRASGVNPASATAGAAGSSAERTFHRLRSWHIVRCAPSSAIHRVGIVASASVFPSSLRHSAGRNAAKAGASIAAAPGWLRTCTVPLRAASSSPVIPVPGLEASSSPSSVPPGTRRSSTSTCCRPRRVFRNTRPDRTVRSRACTSAQPRSRESARCSGQCGSSTPGVSIATKGMRSSLNAAAPDAATSGAAARTSASCHASKNGRSWRTWVGPEQLRQYAREQAAAFAGIADAERAAGPVGEHAPLPVRTAHEVGGIGLQKALRRRWHGSACAQEGGIGMHQRCRQRAAREQRLRAINVRQDRFKQTSALAQPGLQRGEFVGCDRQRHRVAMPGRGPVLRRPRVRAGARGRRAGLGRTLPARPVCSANAGAPRRGRPPSRRARSTAAVKLPGAAFT